MNKKNNLFILACFFSLFINTSCQVPENSVKSPIQNKIDSTYLKENIPGIFVATINDHQRNYYSAGFADLENKKTFDSTMVFEIGSITKTFTAYVLSSVLNKNGIDVNSSILKYLPDSVQKNLSLQKITFLSLMNHTSGLPRLPANVKVINDMQPYENYSETNLFSYLKSCSIKSNGQSNYSNLGAGLAGVLAQRISGKTYAELLNQYIFTPFNMSTSGVSNADAVNKSEGYFSKNKKTDYWNMNILTPAGGIHSNGVEMLNYLQNMAFPESAESKSIVEKITIPTISLNPQISVCLAWHTLQLKNNLTIYWHNGGTYGFSAFCAFLKNKSKAVLVIINQFNKNETSDGLGFEILKQLMSEE